MTYGSTRIKYDGCFQNVHSLPVGNKNFIKALIAKKSLRNKCLGTKIRMLTIDLKYFPKLCGLNLSFFNHLGQL